MPCNAKIYSLFGNKTGHFVYLFKLQRSKSGGAGGGAQVVKILAFLAAAAMLSPSRVLSLKSAMKMVLL